MCKSRRGGQHLIHAQVATDSEATGRNHAAAMAPDLAWAAAVVDDLNRWQAAMT